MTIQNSEKILEVKNLQTTFKVEGGKFNAVDGINFNVYKGKTLGIVGESGCGKSVTSLSIMRLIPTPPGDISGGEIVYKGKDLLKLPISEMRKIRGNEISMIFQEPMTSLNPVFTVGDQIREAIQLHQKVSKKEAIVKSIEMLKLVGIPSPEKRIDDYPHQLSGGMRQRVMIAMALSCNPNILIADEPTTALDVTIQAQILDLMRKLRETLGMAMMLITHDLGVVAETADEVIVMYAGKIVEQGLVKEIFANPKHPYTRGLLQSIPTFNKTAVTSGKKKARLDTISGIVPSLLELPVGCRFQSRCPFATDECKSSEPKLRSVGSDHDIACFKDLPAFEKRGAK